MNAIDFSPLYRNTVGFDGLFNLLDSTLQQNPGNGYPPYDIESVEDGKYRITIAVAGFSEDELDIQTEKGVLTIRGKRSNSEDNKFLHNGIAKRSFERKFQLADFVEVESAELSNGLLQIGLVKEVPEALKPKQIAIGGGGVGSSELSKNKKSADSLAAA